MDAKPTNSALLFPRVLHGTAKDVRKHWGRLTRQAWKLKSWDLVVAELEMVSVDDLPGGILLGQPLSWQPFGSRNEKHWRLYLVPDVLAGLAVREFTKESSRRRPADPSTELVRHGTEMAEKSETHDLGNFFCELGYGMGEADSSDSHMREDALHRSGLKWFWYLIAIVYSFNSHGPRSQAAWRMIFEGLRRNLDTLLRLRPRLVDLLGNKGDEGLPAHQLYGFFIRSANIAFDLDVPANLADESPAPLITELKARGLW